MSSTLTFQLQQQQKKAIADNLPSPPTSSYGGDEVPGAGFPEGVDLSTAGSSYTEEPPLTRGNSVSSSVSSLRRDSLPTHFNALTIQQFSKSLPENYTIDHSSPAATAAQTIRRPSHSPRPDSPFNLAHSPASTAAAAATGGRTIRNRRQSESSSRKSQQIHRCEECGKIYKHPNCLSKHRWEHSEQWELTSKLLLTKHQQVQMLEAAAILVSMDHRRNSQQLDKLDKVRGGMEEEEMAGCSSSSSSESNISSSSSSNNNNNNNNNDDDDDDILIDMDEDEVKPEEQNVPVPSLSLNTRTKTRIILAPPSRSRCS